MLRIVLLLVAVSGVMFGGLRADEAPGMLDGFRIEEWEFVSAQKVPIGSVVQVEADGIVTVKGTPVGYLRTRTVFEDYELQIEWRWTDQPGNSGILLHVAAAPDAGKTWPRCLQVQMKHGRAGDLLPMEDARFTELLSTPAGAKTPQLNRRAEPSERPPGEWNLAEVTCRGGTVEVRINGVLQNRVTGCVPAAGWIGLQFENAAYAFRNVRVRPIGKR